MSCVTPHWYLPGLIRVPVFLSSSPDLSQLPTPHVHSTPAPPPGPSQPISHASMATASSFTPAPIQGTVSSFSLSLWTCCSPAQREKLHRKMVAQPWTRDTLATSQAPSQAPVPVQLLVAVCGPCSHHLSTLRWWYATERAKAPEPGLRNGPSSSSWQVVAAAACELQPVPCICVRCCPFALLPSPVVFPTLSCLNAPFKCFCGCVPSKLTGHNESGMEGGFVPVYQG